MVPQKKIIYVDYVLNGPSKKIIYVDYVLNVFADLCSGGHVLCPGIHNVPPLTAPQDAPEQLLILLAPFDAPSTTGTGTARGTDRLPTTNQYCLKRYRI